jgi:5-methylcytosine-specific restriction endonuclease McrA
MKTCKRCDVPLASGNTHKWRTMHCNDCGRWLVNAASQRYTAANPERRREIGRRHYANNRDKERAGNKDYRARNRDRVLAYQRKYNVNKAKEKSDYKRRTRAENTALVRERDRLQRSRWAKLNPEKVRAARIRERTNRADVERTLTERQWQETIECFGHACAYCLRTDVEITQDHVIAVSRGGGHSAGNVVPACRSCNSRKGNRPVWTMLLHGCA